MYRTCIYCSAHLGANEGVEAFPVGRQVAFDAAKGRLWAVCARCRRWNLAPLEERWEAIEEAERRFADARLRVQSENVGVAKLRDGTRLVRIGAAPARELAAWRWGGLLQARGRRYRIRSGAAAGTATLAVAGAVVFLGPLTPLLNVALGASSWMAARAARNGVEKVIRDVARARGDRRVLHRAAPIDGGVMDLRRGHLRGAWLSPAADGSGGIALHVPAAEAVCGIGGARFLGLEAVPAPVTLGGEAARNTLARALVRVNAAGATPGLVDEAVEAIARAPSPGAYLEGLAARRVTLGLPGEADVLFTSVGPSGVDLYWLERAAREGVPPERHEAWKTETMGAVCGERWGGTVLSVSLEMALHDEAERRALEGELTLLRAAWREAEEIAALADRLAGEAAVPAEGARAV